MKRILFIISSFDSGGVSKSLLNLLNVIDATRYQIDLLVMNCRGELHSEIPKDIRLLDIRNFYRGWRKCAFLMRILHILRWIVSRIDYGFGGVFLSKIFPPIERQYDVAVDYQGQSMLYYMVDRIRAKTKLSFFHSDYERWRYYERVDRKYYNFVDAIFTVSERCVEAMKRVFPEYSKKIMLMENISQPAVLRGKAKESVSDPLCNDKLSILTVGHLCENKGTSLAMEAAAILKKSGLAFKWYFLGSNSNPKYYANFAKKLGIENEIVFLGMKKNPYPYISQCDIFVLPSKFEGKSVALDEAKIFRKPVVITNFSTAKDQFIDRINGSICEMSADALSDAILELVNNDSLRIAYVKNLSESENDNSETVKVLYEIFDNPKIAI